MLMIDSACLLFFSLFYLNRIFYQQFQMLMIDSACLLFSYFFISIGFSISTLKNAYGLALPVYHFSHFFISNCFLSTIPNSMKKAGHRIDPVQPFSYALLPPVIRIQIHIHLFAVLQQTLCKIHVESMRDCHIPLRINHNLKHHSVTGTMDNAQNISPHDLCIVRLSHCGHRLGSKEPLLFALFYRLTRERVYIFF